MSIAIKICCMMTREEALLATAAGADALGFVSAMPSGPGPIDEDLIADIIDCVPAGPATVLLTSRVTTADIVAQQKRTRAGVLQLVDAVPFDELRRLREALPGVALMQVIHVTGPASVDEAVAVAPLVDVLLLDSGNPSAAVRELGGTGRVHDWSLSRAIVAAAGRPVFLAGGLKADNVREAIAAVRPYGVDVCSGVRSGGRLDPDRLAAFVLAARGVFPERPGFPKAG